VGGLDLVVSIQLHVSALYVWPSSGCDLTYRAAIQDVWGVLLGYWGLGVGELDLVFSIQNVNNTGK